MNDTQGVGVTVLVCTYNRAADLRELLGSVLAQRVEGGWYEVVVVDNNSSDGTAAVLAECAAGHPRLRHVREERQGKSYALNTGLALARGAVLAVIDDDQLMPEGYLQELVRAFREHPEVSFIGGKVLPLWNTEPPRWLTPAHWSPLGMSDYGDHPFFVDAGRPVCLLTCAFHLPDLVATGGFREELGVTGDLVGSTEDADILERLWSGGRRGLYLPSLVLWHRTPPHRLTRQYHRRWHRGHGRFSSLRRQAETERSAVRLFDVPGHMYRQAARDALRWVLARLGGRREEAFRHETELCFFWGFLRQRLVDRRGAAALPLPRAYSGGQG